MKGPTLREQLTRASMVTTLIALLLSAGSLLVYEWLTYRGAWVDDLRTQADLIAHSSAAALVFDDPRSAQENLALLRLKPRIRAAAIFEAGGRPFATYSAGAGTAAPTRTESAMPAGTHRFVGSALELSYPVDHDGERVGSVYLKAEHDVWARALTYAAIEAAVMAAALALSYFIFGRLQQVVTDPLARITQTAREVIERRDWKLRAPDSANRDISVLVQGFNGMLAEVETRTGELEREMLVRLRAEAQLRLADRKKDEFLAILGHELRNPLAPIVTALDLMTMSGRTHFEREREVIRRQAEHLIRLVDDLLDISRVTSEKLQLKREPLELWTVIERAIEVASPLLEQRNHRLVVDVSRTSLVVEADPVRLSQVFANLLTNAAKYTNAGGQITIRARRSAEMIEVVVEDNGNGITSDLLPHIFEPFTQSDRTIDRAAGGLGLGLALVKSLTQLHGGTVAAHSDGAGTGSVFTVRLPEPTAQVAAVDDLTTQRVSILRPASARVLVVDDNADAADTLADVLRRVGYEVAVAHDAPQALDMAAKFNPSIALLDIGLPVMDGYELARRIRQQLATPPRLVAVSGYGHDADLARSRAAGFEVHLGKPVAMDVLVNVLTSLPLVD